MARPRKPNHLPRLRLSLGYGNPDSIRPETALNDMSREIGFEGLVSSYNVNTFHGRVYVVDEQRPIPFVLTERARNEAAVAKIVRSLARNAVTRDTESDIEFGALKITT